MDIFTFDMLVGHLLGLFLFLLEMQSTPIVVDVIRHVCIPSPSSTDEIFLQWFFTGDEEFSQLRNYILFLCSSSH